MVAIDLNKQEVLNADSNMLQQFISTGNIDQVGNTTMLFIIAETKGTISGFSQGIMRVLYFILP